MTPGHPTVLVLSQNTPPALSYKYRRFHQSKFTRPTLACAFLFFVYPLFINENIVFFDSTGSITYTKHHKSPFTDVLQVIKVKESLVCTLGHLHMCI